MPPIASLRLAQDNSSGAAQPPFPTREDNEYVSRSLQAKITVEASSVSNSLKELGGTVAGYAEVNKISDLKNLAKQLGPLLGSLGPFVSFLANLYSAPDPVKQLVQQEFAGLSAQLTAISTKVGSLQNYMDASNAVQTYIAHRDDLLSLWSELQTFMKAPLDTGLLIEFSSACQRNSPSEYLTYASSELTADGSCGFPTQCLLDPSAGLGAVVSYSRPDFLEFIKVFLKDAALAVELVSSCAGVAGASNDTINNVILPSAQEKYSGIVDALASYFGGPLATAFWTQFVHDVSDGVNLGDEFAGIASKLQGTLSSKYDHMKWAVAVWNPVTGSDKEGVIYNDCSADPPPESCTTSGGVYYKFRYGLKSGNSISFAVFFYPASEAVASLDAIQHQVDSCGKQSGVFGDMLKLSQCVAQAPHRGVLAVKGGNGFQESGADSIYFTTQRVGCEDHQPLVGCGDAFDVSLVVLPAAT